MKSKTLLAYSSPRWLAFFVALALALCLPSASLSADAATTAVSVSAPSQPVAAGEQFTVNIFVAPNTGLSGMQFDFHFNPSLVTIDSVQEGPLLAQEGATTYFNPGQIDNQSGTLTGVFGVITTPGQTISTQAIFATIRLTAKTQGGNCPLGLSSVVVGDINGNPVPVSTEDSALELTGAGGSVFNWWALSVIMGVAFMLIGATTVVILWRRRRMMNGLETRGSN